MAEMAYVIRAGQRLEAAMEDEYGLTQYRTLHEAQNALEEAYANDPCTWNEKEGRHEDKETWAMRNDVRIALEERNYVIEVFRAESEGLWSESCPAGWECDGDTWESKLAEAKRDYAEAVKEKVWVDFRFLTHWEARRIWDEDPR